MKKIDPIERALDAYFELDTDQQSVFSAAVRHVEQYARKVFTAGSSIEQSPTPKRGRPPGSKNRKLALAEPASPLSPEGFDATALFAGNGAPTEGL